MRERKQVGTGRIFESMLDDAELESSLDFLASLQLKSGMVPWFPGGRADPWNHAEAALALAVGGRMDEAIAGLRWLLDAQNGDGTWCHFYLSNGVAEPRRDTNTCCYPVLLVSLIDRAVDDRKLMEPYVDMALRAVNRVVASQRADGSIPWALEPSGEPYPTSLVAASSSICDSLQIAAKLCERFGINGSKRYLDAMELLRKSVRFRRGPYADTSGWAMDHYYPAIAGIPESIPLSDQFLDRFYEPDWGVRCLERNAWFTSAETAEAAMALHIEGEEALAKEMFLGLGRFRGDNGGYLTGVVSPTGGSFPLFEQSSYSVAAVVLAGFVLSTTAGKSMGTTLLHLFA